MSDPKKDSQVELFSPAKKKSQSSLSGRNKNGVGAKRWLQKSIKERNKIKNSLSKTEKLKLLRGMILTRATDNALKQLFLSGEIIYQGKGFQGKGFRSLGQEAIYGAGLKLNTGAKYVLNNVYAGDVAAPLIRDLGVFLSLSGGDVATAINAQAGKMGVPCHGRDLHLGNFSQGLLTPAAPLAIATCTLVGLALSFKLKQELRVAISFIGEGGSSLGEWHEAINFAAVNHLPMVFCVQNNQRALSTPNSQQCRASKFADKALGYGINSLIVDGNDVEEVAAAFKFSCDEARNGGGPLLIELETMRMCGHAHHDDMLYLGKEPRLGLALPELSGGGYVNASLYEEWRKKDPIVRYQRKLIRSKIIGSQELKNIESKAIRQVELAIENVKERPWPKFNASDDELVFKKPLVFLQPSRKVYQHYQFDRQGSTYLQAIAEGTKRAFLRHQTCRVIGEDVAQPYGNAFMLYKETISEFADRFINTPISENAIVGACVGMAMGGMRPIGEMQFNDFVACAMNQVVNNAGKNYFRLGINVPMVLRMPYGGMRRAGPYHSQDTSPWFYRSPGLKIMAPSTPLDAMHMLIKAVDDPDPVLFYEHIALYRDPKIKQQLNVEIDPSEIEGAALVSAGEDVSFITYGAYVHTAKKVSSELQKVYGKSADVIDLRYLKPVDFAACYESVKKCGRALLLGEDAKTGSILESIASRIGADCFKYLDAPLRVIGSRDIPVPYSPSLEDDYLLNEKEIINEALQLLNY